MTTRTVQIAGRSVVVHTEYSPPPIPPRNCDWSATDDNYEPGHPVGWGATEQAAVDDLVVQLLDRAEGEAR